MEKTFRLFDHTADLGIEVFGETETALFAHAALALVALTTDLEKIASVTERHFSIRGDDRTGLFINFLREVLYLINGEGFLPREVHFDEFQPGFVRVKIRGESFNTEKHMIYKEIKAVTYHQASVEQTRKGWKGRVICDV